MKVFKKAALALLGATLGCCMFAGCIFTKGSRGQILCKELYFVHESGAKVEDGEIIPIKLTDANMCYQLHWVMETEQTSNKEVVFESNNPMVKVNQLGMVTFLEETDVVITIKAIDGSDKFDSITLVPKRGAASSNGKQ